MSSSIRYVAARWKKYFSFAVVKDMLTPVGKDIFLSSSLRYVAAHWKIYFSLDRTLDGIRD